MATALVVHKDRLPQSQKMHRAAQYVRISTDYQQYSIENQAEVIATYAEHHKLTIVRTYRDEGESGLKIENRAGLSELIDDVRSGQIDFGHLLVFDVSRWGRFQDVDESAHYEFICRKGQAPPPRLNSSLQGCTRKSMTFVLSGNGSGRSKTVQ